MQKGVQLNICEIAPLLSVLFLHLFCQPQRLFLHPSLLSATIESDALYSRQTERETHRHITRQIDQEVVELSMQRITAATTCDHRGNEKQGDRARVTEGKKRKNR